MKPFLKKIVSLGLVALMAITPLVQAATPAYAIPATDLYSSFLSKLQMGPGTPDENEDANVEALVSINFWLKNPDIQAAIKTGINNQFTAGPVLNLTSYGFSKSNITGMFDQMIQTQGTAADLFNKKIDFSKAKVDMTASSEGAYDMATSSFKTSFKALKNKNGAIKEAIKTAIESALSLNNMVEITATATTSGTQYAVTMDGGFESTVRANVFNQLKTTADLTERNRLTNAVMEIYNIVKESVIAEMVKDVDVMYELCILVENTQIGTVVYLDGIAPEIKLKGAAAMTLKVGDTYTEPGYTATDVNFDGDEVDLTKDVKVTGTVDTTKAGVYELVYNVSDNAGNAAVAVKRTVTVTAVASGDKTAPVITLKGTATMSLTSGTAYVEPGFTASDLNALGATDDLTSKVTVTGAVDTTRVGTYVLNYNVSDAAGNAAVEVKRTVNVTAAGGTGGGGGGGAGTVTITPPVTPLSPVTPPTVVVPTPEIPKAPVKVTPAQALAKLKELGIIKGKSASLTKPVSATAFADAMVKVLGIKKLNKGETSLKALKRVGVLTGVTLKGNEITRDQMATVIYNIYVKFKTAKTVDKSVVFNKDLKTKAQFNQKLHTVLEKLYKAQKVDGKVSVTEADLVVIYFSFFM